ncbi:serine/threonine-protein kinase [Mycobacterium persicum]|uniref:serine/threonine-protein kinase n=1 Tax=Mycobacterium persicum TaxID=1487726 RepID=UPI001F08116E|nr:serine/threonine-protein kinase [Mycobacterium persicum]
MKTRRVEAFRKPPIVPSARDSRTQFRFPMVAVLGYGGGGDRVTRRAIAGLPMQRASALATVYAPSTRGTTCASADPARRVGTQVANYRVEAVVSSGGMGTVYLARHPSLPRRDALKILDGPLARDPRFRVRFMREADLAAGLHHPNIVAVYDRGDTPDGALWIAMEYVRGTDADVETAAGRMPPARAERIVGEVAMALDHLHRRNLLHRDVKPANILLSPGLPGEPERVVLADFGIARSCDDHYGLTRTGDVITTVAYASPELLQGWPLDARTDIYSLGCTLFHLLTGHAPFSDRPGLAAVMMAHIQHPAPRLSDYVAGLPVALDGVVATAMAKDPGDRYQTAGEFARAVRAASAVGCAPRLRFANPPAVQSDSAPARQSEATQAAGPGWLPHVQRACRPGRFAARARAGKAAVLIAVIAVLLCSLGFVMANRHHATAQRPSHPAQAPAAMLDARDDNGHACVALCPRAACPSGCPADPR